MVGKTIYRVYAEAIYSRLFVLTSKDQNTDIKTLINYKNVSFSLLKSQYRIIVKSSMLY